MKQTGEERAAALVTLLPKLVEHLDAHARIRSCLSRIQLDSAFGPPPRLADHKLELWEAIELRNTLRWRTRTILDALLELEDFAPRLAHAVWCEHVVPWPAWNPDDRQAWAAEGVLWMQGQIKGEIPYCVENALENEQARVERRNRTIRERLAYGCSIRSIAREVGCSTKTVQAVKSGRRLVGGHLV